MATYIVTPTETRTFTLARKDEVIGRLTYANWFSFQSNIHLADQAPFTVEATGFDGSNVTVKQDGNVLIDLKLTWNGQFTVNTTSDDAAGPFVFKQKGVVNTKFVLLTSDGVDLLVVEPGFTWKKSTIDYQLSVSDAFEGLASKDLLMLVIIHCANYYIDMMTLATAAVVMS